jgi:hypothetical protein
MQLNWGRSAAFTLLHRANVLRYAIQNDARFSEHVEAA